MTEYMLRAAPLRRTRALALLVLVGCVWLAIAPRASAASPTPAWAISAPSTPTNFAPGSTYGSGGDAYAIVITNSGGAPTNGSAITITDTLPTGLTPDATGGSGSDASANSVSCATSGQVVTCTDADSTPLQPGRFIMIQVPVDVSSSPPPSVTNQLTVSGGGALTAALPSALGQTAISSSNAPFGLQSSSFTITDQAGQPYTQAGGHPYEVTSTVALTTDNKVNVPGNVKDVGAALPPGLVGNPNSTPKCSVPDLIQQICAGSTQVGTLAIFLLGGNPQNIFPVYNIVPPPGVPAQFGAFIAGADVFIDSTVRTGGDYGLTSTLSGITGLIALTGSQLTLWGEPADPSHDSERVCPGRVSPCSSGAPLAPFLSNPTSCPGQQLTTTVQADSWQAPGAFSSELDTEPAITGCDHVTFNPSITVTPDTSAADSPSGLNVDVRVPQNQDPNGLATANLKDAVVTLPAGVSIDPSAASGLSACTPAQIGMNDANEPTCPESSKIGTAEIDSPLLSDPLIGGIYLAQQNNNPFGSTLAIYATAEADGVLIKLAGNVVADPVTGQLTTTFSNNPQLPFTDFKLGFFGGPEAVLATPGSCGTFTTTSSFTSWSGQSAPTGSDSFPISSGCVSGFSPSFTAGAQNPQAGAFSPFVLSFSRSDADQNVSGLSVTLPPGMLARLGDVAQCSDAQLGAAAASSAAAEAANPSCPSGSQVGTAETGAGVGPEPFFLPGNVYLTGSYKGAPYGLAVVVPVRAGPLDLGTVVVRQALDIDPTTAQVTDVSDPFPTILDGIPLRIRRVDVTLNRPGFTLNPTSCDPMAVTGILSSTGGLDATFSPRFQVGGCAELGFSPKLKMALSGRGRTRSGAHPALTATLTQPGGQANLRNVRVVLPLSLALDPANSQHVCPYATAQAVHGGTVGCSASTIVGTATADTPLLSAPLTGPVYLVQGIRFNKQGQAIHTLPSLLIPLRGQIALDLRAQSSVSGGRLVTTFATIPDAPVAKFVLTITGGPSGLLVITGRGLNICRAPQLAAARLGAQSGKTEAFDPRLTTAACPAHHGHR